MYRTKEQLKFYLNCLKSMDTVNWRIETQRKHVLVSNRVENKVMESIGIFDKESRSWGWPFIAWDVLEKDFLVDDQLTAEIHVKIKKTTGIYKDNLRSFDETMEEFSDVVLVVNEEKFYVLKLVSFNNFQNMFLFFLQFFSIWLLTHPISRPCFWEISMIRRNRKSN